MVLKLEKIGQITIVDPKGRPSSFFQTLWQRTITAIQNAVNDNAALTAQLEQQLALLQATQQAANVAQQAANEAQASADAAGGGSTTSGSATGSIFVSSTSFTTGPVVNLTGVVAGTLTISGSGPTGGSLDSGSSMGGQFRIFDVTNNTTVFTGNFSVTESGVTNDSIADVAAFSSSESSTGAVSYRIDARRLGPGGTATVNTYIFCRRA